jgi:sugar lactone lactonase YvrE
VPGRAPDDADWRVVLAGLAFPEGIRWHAGALWLSDVFARRILRLRGDGGVQVVARVPGRPSGLGWRPDGTMLAVSMTDRRLLAVPGAGASPDVVSDLRALTGGDCNDLLVDRVGRSYVGNFGYDYAAGHPRQPTALVMVDVDDAARVVADDLWFPNGMAMTPDGSTLLVAETPAERISSFAVGLDGSLGDRRVLDLDGLRPDGLALDAAGALWVASPGTGELARITSDGRVVERGPAPGGVAQGCVLGGTDGRTLFVCSTPTHEESDALDRLAGRIFAREVAVPAAAGHSPEGPSKRMLGG